MSRVFRRPDRVLVAAAALMAFQLGVRAQALWGSWFWQDDFVLTHRARTMPFFTFVFGDYHGHWQPGQFLIVRVLAGLAPLSWSWHAGTVLCLQLAADLAVLWLLVEVFGRRRAVLLPYAVYLFCPLTLTSLLWFSAALQALPLQGAMAALLACHVRLVCGGSWRWSALALATFLLVLTFWEKGVLLPVVAFLLEATCLREGSARDRVRATVGSHPRLWGGYLLLAAAYLTGYVALTSASAGRATPATLARLAWETVATTVTPALFGGPWRGSGAVQSLSPPATHPRDWLAWQAVALVLLAGWRARGWASVRAWSLPAVVLLFDLAAVAATRLDFLGGFIGRDTRYVAELSVVMALALGLAFIEPGRPRPAPLPVWVPPSARSALLTALLMAYVTSALTTTVAAAADRNRSSAKAWVTQARAQLRQQPGATVLDAPVPTSVVSRVFGGEANASHVLGSLPEGRGRFDRMTASLSVLDPRGRLVPVDLPSGARVLRGPDAGCGWSIPGGAARTLPAPRSSGRLLLRLGYYGKGQTIVRVDVAGERNTVALDQAIGQVYLFPHRVVGVLDRIQVSGVDAGQPVCITEVAVAPLPSHGM